MTIKATAETAVAQAQVEALGASVSKVGDAGRTAGDGLLKGEAGLQKLREEIRETVDGFSKVQPAATKAAEGTSLFSKAVAGLSGTKGNLILILVALLTHLKEVNDWFAKASDKAVAFFSAAGQGTKVLDEHGRVVEALDPKYVKLATAQDLHARALKLMQAGLIPATNDMKVLDAEAALFEARMRGTAGATEVFAQKIKDMGFKAVEAFESVDGKGKNFIAAYKFYLENQGPAAARIFAEQNASALDAVESHYIKLGKDVPPELKKISDGIGLIPKAAAEAAKSEESFKKLSESISDLATKQASLTKALADNGRAFTEHSAKVEADRKASIEAIDATTQKTIVGLQEQVKQTEAAHAARSISDSEYNATINRLIAEQAKAKLDGYEKEKQVNTDAAKDLTDYSEKYRSETEKVKEAIDDVATKQEEAAGKLKTLNVERDAELRVLAAVKPLYLQAGVDLGTIAAAQGKLGTETKATAGGIQELANQFLASQAQVGPLGSGIDALTTKMNAATAAAKALAAAMDAVTQ